MIDVAIEALLAGSGNIYYGIELDPERRNNIIIVHHTTDDSRKEVVPRYLANLASRFYKYSSINKMDTPWAYKGMHSYEDMIMARELAWKQLTQWVNEGRLVIKDQIVGKTLSTASMIVNTMRDKYPDRKVLYIVDNMYNLGDMDGESDDVAKSKIMAGRIKDFSVREDLTTFATIEYNKGNGGKSRIDLNQMIAYSKSLEYSANYICHLLNEMHTDPETTPLFYWDHTIPPEKRNNNNRSSIIRSVVSKNKITDYKGDAFYYLLGEKSKFLEVTNNDLPWLSEGAKTTILKHIGKMEEPSMDTDALSYFYDQINKNIRNIHDESTLISAA